MDYPVLEHTSVPPWALSPSVDDDATTPDHDARILEVTVDDEAPVDPDELARTLSRAVVGTRLVLTGPLVAVLRARSVALEAGFLDEEIHVRTTTVDRLPVMCAHCAAVTVARARIDDVIDCAGCGEPLLVYHHVSRRQAAFLGFKVDAETWEPEGEVRETTHVGAGTPAPADRMAS